jgi:hypothetical protein
VFAPETSLIEVTDAYADKNPTVDRRRFSLMLENLPMILNNHVGLSGIPHTRL